MPRWMRQFLSRNSLRWHFCVALGWAVVVRALCAYFVYGPQALDDYKHGVWPAYQHFAGQALDLPDYRSHLLVWILSAFIRVGSWFEVSTALTQVRVMYFGLAGLSLLGLVGTYLFVRSFRSRLFPPLALYLVAVYPLMPFVSTRAFGEAIAMSFVLLGFGVLEDALFCAFILTYAQGMSLLQKASEEKGFGLDLAEIARIWRGGCIIRSKLLELIRKAYSSGQNIESLLLDKGISDMLNSRAGSLRKTVVTFNENGIPSACFSSALAYFDAFRTERLPANLIQAQRDFFGAHTYQRIDRDGTFHTPDWEV